VFPKTFLTRLLIWYLLIGSLQVSASSSDKSGLNGVAELPEWQQLIKVNKSFSGKYTSDIVADGFYLASGDPPSPLDELVATLESFRSRHDVNKTHAQCRFPARLFWLKQQLPMLESTLPTVECPALEEWIRQSGKQQFHLVHVSGYFYNPASAFGHLLLRVGDGDSERGLSDVGINFGARIPAGDGSFKYILKGLFGGYTASFSSKQHYLQDLVYSGGESRDMWAYELNLSKNQSTLLSYYLWELADIPFKYFFLQKNCAYRIAEALEFVIGGDFIKPHDVSYAPIKLFNRLQEFHEQSDESLIKKVRFIPSHQRENHNTFVNLPEEAAKKSNTVLETGAVDIQLPVASLDFLLDYFDYKLTTATKLELASLRKLKRRVLEDRLKIPTKSLTTETVAQLPPPGNGPKPGTIRFGVSRDNVFEFEVSPFSFGLKDQNRGSMVDSSFEVLSLELVQEDAGLKFSQLTLLEIQNFGVKEADIYGETNLAWRAGVSLINRDGCSGVCLDGFLSGGFGRSWRIGGGLFFSTINSELSASLREQNLGISFGSLYNFSGSVRGYWESEYTLYSKKPRVVAWSHQMEVRYSFLRNHAIDFALSHSDGNDVMIGYQYKW